MSTGSSRGQRGAPNRGRGSRGTTPTSRGAFQGFSRKFNAVFTPSAPRAMRDTTNLPPPDSKYNGRYCDPNYNKRKYSLYDTEVLSAADTSNNFGNERDENAAKRLQREQTFGTANVRGRGDSRSRGDFRGRGRGRGDSRPIYANTSRRFKPSPDPKVEPTNPPSIQAPSNPFATESTMTSRGTNPFAPKPDKSTNALARFGAPSQPLPTSTPFGGPSQQAFSSNTSNPFGAPSLPTQNTAPSSVFGMPSGPTITSSASKVFYTPSQPSTLSALSLSFAATQSNSAQPTRSTSFGKPSAGNPFAKPLSTNGFSDSNIKNVIFGRQSQSKASPFGAPSGSPVPPTTSKTPASQFGSPSCAKASSASSRPRSSNSSTPQISRKFSAPSTNEVSQKSSSPSPFKAATATNPLDEPSRSSKSLAKKIDQVLKRKKIIPPQWPGLDPNDERPIGSILPLQKYWNDYRDYREKARTALIAAGLIDNPDVPKKLSEAIDFKGTCEEMCPEWEKIDRIITNRYDTVEKEVYSDGSISPFPVMDKMVKIFGRAAAGQDAPLPADIRSVAALRRTTDYLFHTVLGDSELPAVYGFLWDRTRAVRRDFVFHSYMSPSELVDQVYCLERMVRYHVVAAHLMSKEGIISQVFNEQQELEQLSRALLSLMHAYEDCKAQEVKCENEMEFRAYNILWTSRKNPGYLAEVQNWGWSFWGESEEIQLAVSLAEALQVTWGKSTAETDIAHNAFSRFFSIVDDKRVSYTMACFAETCFNSVRKNILKTILKSYRKQRDQTKDWTVSKLNEYLHLDDEAELITFCEAHGLHIDQVDGVDYLSFEFGDNISDPHPPLPQGYSNDVVERKRGDHSLLEVISQAVYEDEDDKATIASSEEDGLFVKDDSVPQRIRQQAIDYQEPSPEGFMNKQELKSSTPTITGSVATPEPESTPKATSIFDRIQHPKSFGGNFFTPPSDTTGSTPVAIQKPEASSILKSQSLFETSSLFTKQADAIGPSTISQKQPAEEPETSLVTQPTPLFSFLQQSKPEQAPTTQSLPAFTTPPAESQEALFFSQSAAPSPTFQPQPLPNFSVSQEQAQSGTHESQMPAPVPSPSFLNPTQAFNNAPQVVEPAKEVKPQVSEQEAGQIQNESQVQSLLGPRKDDRDAKVTAVAEWVALGDEGLLQHFIAYQVELILHQAARIYVDEENQRIVKETEQKGREEADAFRYRSLATKYVNLWREKSRLMWLRRRGREARQARREFAESKRAFKAAQSANLVEDFKASTSSLRQESLKSSTSSHRPESLESMLDATGVLNGVHGKNSEARNIAQSDESGPAPKRRRSSSSLASSTGKHKRIQSENPLRRSLLSDPSYLQGGSRIHFMPNYDIEEDSRPRASGVQTDYFRLKARGITTLPDGTPLASSVAKSTISKKRSLDGIRKPWTPQDSKLPPSAQSVPVKPSRPANSTEDIQTLKAKAKKLVAEDKKARQKRTYVDDEEELFERAKRVREQMDEGASWYRKQIERHSGSRSVS